MSKRKLQTKDTPKKRVYALQSSLQDAIIHAYNFIKNEAVEEEVHLSKSECIVRVSKIFGHCCDTIRKVIKNFESGNPLVTPGKKRKSAYPVTGIDDFTREALGRFCYDQLNKGGKLTVKLIHEHLKRNYETYSFKGSLTSVRTILKGMGFKWSKEDSITYVKESENIKFKRACFVRAYVRNMESENPLPVVFLDETWIFMNGSKTYSWNNPKVEKGVVKGIMRRRPEGGRLVILHAGTKDGFIPGASLIFASNLKKDQDYHGAMNGKSFQRWVKEQLIVGLKEYGPCMIVMDNASYHCNLIDPQPTTSWKKDRLIDWLQINGVAVPPNANRTELQTLCKNNKSSLKRFVVDEILEIEGHRVLRLPPYHSTFNAIELVWSVAKRYYNDHVTTKEGQGFKRAKAAWEEALAQVTNDVWKKEVHHTEKIIMDYFNKEIRDAALVQDVHITVGESSDSDTEEEEEEMSRQETEEELATPLEPVAGPSRLI